MNNELLKKGIWALRWEAFYRQKQDGKHMNYFLASMLALDPDFEKYIHKFGIAGDVLDIGTGLGEQAIYLAKMGLSVTGTDVSPTALQHARELAGDVGVTVKFIEDDILNTSLMDEFDLVVDRGCFTILPQNCCDTYISTIKGLLKLDGWLFLKADKKKTDEVIKMVDESEFRIHTLTISAYPGANGMIPAILLIAQKII